ncbi:MAG: M15 family metallopeptidase [bacterium]
MTLEEALRGKEIPDEIKEELSIISVPHISFDGNKHEGQLIVHKDVAREMREIFEELFKRRFPIHQIIPITHYNWDDDASMAANNTSAFSYRVIYGETKRLSNHSYGRAIDLNPLLNPYIGIDGAVAPSGAVYDISVPGTITEDIAAIFKSCGWKWGGDWNPKDWQHFEKTPD